MRRIVGNGNWGSKVASRWSLYILSWRMSFWRRIGGRRRKWRFLDKFGSPGRHQKWWLFHGSSFLIVFLELIWKLGIVFRRRKELTVFGVCWGGNHPFTFSFIVIWQGKFGWGWWGGLIGSFWSCRISLSIGSVGVREGSIRRFGGVGEWFGKQQCGLFGKPATIVFSTMW